MPESSSKGVDVVQVDTASSPSGESRAATATPSSIASGPDPEAGDTADKLDHWDTFIIDPEDDQVTMIIGHNKYPLLVPTTSQYDDVRSVVPLTPIASRDEVQRSIEEVKRVMPGKSEEEIEAWIWERYQKNAEVLKDAEPIELQYNSLELDKISSLNSHLSWVQVIFGLHKIMTPSPSDAPPRIYRGLEKRPLNRTELWRKRVIQRHGRQTYVSEENIPDVCIKKSNPLPLEPIQLPAGVCEQDTGHAIMLVHAAVKGLTIEGVRSQLQEHLVRNREIYEAEMRRYMKEMGSTFEECIESELSNPADELTWKLFSDMVDRPVVFLAANDRSTQSTHWNINWERDNPVIVAKIIREDGSYYWKGFVPNDRMLRICMDGKIWPWTEAKFQRVLTQRTVSIKDMYDGKPPALRFSTSAKAEAVRRDQEWNLYQEFFDGAETDEEIAFEKARFKTKVAAVLEPGEKGPKGCYPQFLPRRNKVIWRHLNIYETDTSDSEFENEDTSERREMEKETRSKLKITLTAKHMEQMLGKEWEKLTRTLQTPRESSPDTEGAQDVSVIEGRGTESELDITMEEERSKTRLETPTTRLIKPEERRKRKTPMQILWSQASKEMKIEIHEEACEAGNDPDTSAEPEMTNIYKEVKQEEEAPEERKERQHARTPTKEIFQPPAQERDQSTGSSPRMSEVEKRDPKASAEESNREIGIPAATITPGPPTPERRTVKHTGKGKSSTRRTPTATVSKAPEIEPERDSGAPEKQTARPATGPLDVLVVSPSVEPVPGPSKRKRESTHPTETKKRQRAETPTEDRGPLTPTGQEELIPTRAESEDSDATLIPETEQMDISIDNVRQARERFGELTNFAFLEYEEVTDPSEEEDYGENYLASHQRTPKDTGDDATPVERTDLPQHKCNRPNCATKMPSQESVQRHITLFHDQGRFECGVCLKEFKTKRALKAHERIHVARWECSKCGERRCYPKEVQLHIETVHEKIKPYHCGTCQKTYGRLIDLQRHEIACKDGKISCQWCGVEFANGKNWEEHCQGVHGEGFVCGELLYFDNKGDKVLCHHTSKSGQARRVHRRRTHKAH